jgi:hypothetical protein
MKETLTGPHSLKSFRYSLAVTATFLLTLLLKFYNVAWDISTVFTGFTVIPMMLLAVMGCVYAVRGIQEPRTTRKVIGMVLNFGFVLLFILLIASGKLDIFRVIH